jgi:hypothetical protein
MHVDSGANALTGQVLDGDSPFEPSVWSKCIGEIAGWPQEYETWVLMYACRLIKLSIGIDDKSPLRPINLAHLAAKRYVRIGIENPTVGIASS